MSKNDSIEDAVIKTHLEVSNELPLALSNMADWLQANAPDEIEDITVQRMDFVGKDIPEQWIVSAYYIQ